MLFTLEALNAAHGDSVLLHWRGSKNDPVKTALIDGGPTVTWKASLKPRLDQLVKAQGKPLQFPFVMISHVDDDHTGGLVKFFEWLSAQSAPRTLDVQTLWLNSFGAITAGRTASVDASSWPVEDTLLDDLAEFAAQALAANQIGGPERDAAATLASVKQGAQIAGYAKQLRILGNSGEDLLLRPSGTGKLMKKTFGALTLTVLAPGEDDLNTLRVDWKKKLSELKQKAKIAELAAYAELVDYVDKSINNLSSIVVLAESNDKRMLLTGDARGDSVITGLRKGGFLANGSMHVDALKMPHHGSWRNMKAEFFDQVKADYYVFSANGKYNNPDKDTLEALVARRVDDSFTIVMTNESNGRKEWLEKKKKKDGRKFRIDVREDPALSICVNLGNESI